MTDIWSDLQTAQPVHPAAVDVWGDLAAGTTAPVGQQRDPSAGGGELRPFGNSGLFLRRFCVDFPGDQAIKLFRIGAQYAVQPAAAGNDSNAGNFLCVIKNHRFTTEFFLENFRQCGRALR